MQYIILEKQSNQINLCDISSYQLNLCNISSEIPQSQTADKLVVPQERATQQLQDTRKTNWLSN